MIRPTTSKISRIRKALSYRVTLTFATGLVCSSIAFAIVWDLEQKKIAQEFAQDGAEIAASIARNLAKNIQNLESIVSFYHASERVSRQEFQKFTQNYLATNPEIQALEWIPLVVNEEREAYEQAARFDGLTQFEITEQNDRQQLIRAKSRPEYFPVYFVEPYQGNEAALGFDLASNPSGLQALQLARDTGKTIATAPITLVQKSDLPQKGLLVFTPIYKNDTLTNSVVDRRQNLEGFALGVFTIEDMVKAALHYLQSKDIDVVLVNESAPPEDRIFYTSNSSLTSEAIEAKTNGRGIYHHHKLTVAEQEWLVVTQPGSAYILQQTTWHPWGVLGGGILLTITLSCYIRERIAVEERLLTKELQLEERVKQRTSELKEAEAKYRHIFENVAEGIFICTLDGKYINANPALASIYGYDSPQKLISELDNIEQQLLVNPEDWRELTAAVELHQAITDFECQIYRADGSKIWISLNIHLFCDRQQQTTYYEGTVIDITARKQAENALLQSNSLLHGISLAQSRFIKDVEPAILFDGLLENLLQITDSEYGFIGEIFYTEGGEPYVEEAYMKMRGKPYLKTHAITNIAWNEETRKFYAENAPQGMEFYNLNTLFGAVMVTGKPVIANNPSTDPRRGGLPEGHPPLNAFLGLPFYSRDRFLGMVGIANRPNGYDRALVDYLEPFLATCSNIIEAIRSEKQRQEAEAALRESEERYRQIVETANEGIWLLNTEGKTSFVNPRVLQMLGYARDEILNQSMFDFIDTSDRDGGKNLTNQIFSLSPGMTKSYDLQFCRQDGSQLWAIVSFSSLVDSASQQIGTLAMMTDISERKQAEIELATARYTAEVASRTKSHFLANMSHELRTPLNGILGSVRLLQRNLKAVPNNQTSLTSNWQKSLNTIESSGSYLLSLLEDILEFAQLETTAVKLHPAPIHLATFLEEISTLVRSQATAKGLTFTAEIPRDLPRGIEADRQRLKQVLVELFNNAIKFTKRGRISFRIVVIDYCEFSPTQSSDEIKLQDYTTLRFEVIDTGVGIDHEQLTHIFQPFEQLGDLHDKSTGTGLGLTIAQQLLRSMNSELQVTSSLGMGSIFWFDITLPLSKTAAIKKRQEINPIIGYKGKQRQLLVVDDKLENRLLLLDILEPLGFAVFTAENGQQEVELAQKILPDLILTDLVMPIKTGFEAVKELRQIPHFKNMPIIAISSSLLDKNCQQSQIADCNAFLSKPIEEQKLLALLQKYLQLEWIYEQPTEIAKETPAISEPETVDVIPPPVEDLKVLYELAMLGSMTKIRQWAISLEELDAQYKPFAERLKQLSQDFQEKAIVNLVEQYLTQE
ncbi:MAG: CHASE domain-containing protein [Xenococcaceae cyanobacterium MO_188.B32]|nr:CHASE domain-containing protein [Xenococcaceae cyanobacterium MO_188.B32]